MNWSKLKEKFPNCYPEILAIHRKTGLDGRLLLEHYLDLKEKKHSLLIMPVLREVEKPTTVNYA